MMEKKQRDLQESDRKQVQKLRVALNNLTEGVVITETDEENVSVQRLLFERLKEELGVLLIFTDPNVFVNRDNNNDEKRPLSLWSIVEPHLPEEIRLNPEEFEKYKGLFSQPLVGQPSEVLKKIGIANSDCLLYKIIQQLRRRMNKLQHLMLPQVVGRIV